MPSDLERAIARERRRLNAEEAAARKRMRDAYRDVTRRLERDIDATLMQIEAFPGDEWRRYHEQRLRVLLAQAEAEYRWFADDAMRVLEQNEARAVSGGAHAAAEMTAAVPATATVGFGANVNRQAVERMVASFTPGSPVRDVLASYGPEAVQTIERAMLDGLAAGKSPRAIKREIMQGINGPYTKARLDALTRTEFMRSSRGSLFDQFEALGVERWRWSAAKSTRTCLACLGMDGKTFPMSDPFMAAHVNCRCIPSPAVDGVGYESGEDWLAKQPEDVQRTMMPSDAAFQAYRDGRVGLNDFVGMHTDRTWGRSVYQRSGRDVMRNVPDAKPRRIRPEADVRDQFMSDARVAVNPREMGDDVAAAWEDYKGNSYQDFNAYLRGQEGRGVWTDDEIRDQLPNLDAGMSRFNLDGDTRVYRGTDFYIGKEPIEWTTMQPGSIITDRGYMSTTFEREVAEQFGFGQEFGPGTVTYGFNITAPRGTNYMPIADMGEAEMVFPRGSRLRVNNVTTETGTNGTVVKVDADLLPAEVPQ